MTNGGKGHKPCNFEDSKKVAKQGGNVAKVAMKELEAKTGKKVVTAINAKETFRLAAKPNKELPNQL